jgi:uncharacterized YigZ family protein
MAENIFYSISNRRTTKIKIKRSVFICTMGYVKSIKEAKKFISKISKENQTATHNCWAYIVRDKGDIFHSSDAGEPSGTAGLPMLNTLKAHNMTNIASVVTRHFGGVKLGVRGLIEAYSQSVKNTIELNILRKLIHTIKTRIEVSYEFNDTLLTIMKDSIVSIEKTEYSDKIVHVFKIELKIFQQLEKLLSEYQSRKLLKFSMIET